MLFTPYTYLFTSVYFFLFISLFTQSSFYSFWLCIELITLLLMGVSYTLFTNSVSQLITYFLLQSISSFLLLVSYLLTRPILLTLSALLKLGIFPFMSWYINVVNRFPNFVFWLTRSFHKAPFLLILLQFNLLFSVELFWSSVLLTTLVRGVLILITLDFRLILVASSVGNNSWFLFSQQINVWVFLSFIFIYSVFLGILVSLLGQSVKPRFFVSRLFEAFSVRWWTFVLCISGLPPFPLFFLKILVIYMLFITNSLSFLFLIFLLFSSFMVAGYLSYIIKFIVFRFSTLLRLSF